MIGEYAVLEGAPSAVAAIDRFSGARLSPAGSDNFVLDAPDIGVKDLAFSVNDNGAPEFMADLSKQDRRRLNFFTKTFEFGHKIIQEEGLKLDGAHIRLDTSAFFWKETGIKLGFGSSAALTVALLGAMTAAAGKPVESDDDRVYLFQNALNAHHAAQGKEGSGVDVAASCFGGVIQYQIIMDSLTRPRLIEEIQLPQDLQMRFVWTGTAASTRELVGKVRRFQESEGSAYRQLMDQMTALSDLGCQALAADNSSEFLDIANRYHLLMDTLGKRSNAPIISDEHRTLATLSKTAGAAYKPSGAGGGDFGIIFSNKAKAVEAAVAAVSAAGFLLLPLKISSNGLANTQDKV